MHLVIITSVIRPKNAPSVFSAEERFHQLLGSIQSARSKIPNSVIVVIEGSTPIEDEIEAAMKSGATEIVHVNADAVEKQSGEPLLMGTFFRSEVFTRLNQEHNFLSISKLSGRYALTDDFVFYYDGETCICKILAPEVSYSGHGALYTRYYSFPIIYLDNFLQGIDKCCHDGIFNNIEHSFYLYQAIPLDKINRDRQKINVAGCIAPTGEYVED